MAREHRDHYYFLAKRLGYRSRAAFKLKELAKRFPLMGKGDVVVDLGAAPGGWLQVAREIVGEEGLVLGVDVAYIRPLPWDNVKLLRLDVTSPEAPEVILRQLPRKADVILSDLSPKVTGAWDLDVARQLHLVSSVIRIIDAALRKGGNAVVKMFQGPGFEEVLAELRRRFNRLKLTRPKASRSTSAEIYAVALGYNPLRGS
ncbi:MAG: 23S rRNA (uridine(2552)-2'-O)-methyltransferase [Thermoprotei archaeon]|nr:MAG: 23S rRNA (uridine(2552)-2'-O)-methyltransferase [Thermoprotei archaeon]